MTTLFFTVIPPDIDAAAIETAAALLRAGEVVAMPTETVYGLAANAFDPAAVKKIFVAKGRPQDNPLIVHISRTEQLYDLAEEVPEAALRLFEAYAPGPLTVILKKKPAVPDAVSAGLPTVAIRMPSHPAARALIEAAGVPLAAPSANLSGFPSPTNADDVSDDMTGRVACILDGGPCGFGIESTVVTLVTDPPRLLRPGVVTLEDLQKILGPVEVDPAVLAPLERGKAAASPGMKYKHYAPKAALTVAKGNLADLLLALYRAPGAYDHVLCFEEDAPFVPLPAVTMGKRSDPLTQTPRLFDALRDLDRAGAENALAAAPERTGVGLGVCNRLYRAAGFRFVEPDPARGRIVGLCGPTGAGKSLAAGALRDRGDLVIDTDLIAREVTAKGAPLLQTLEEHFGADILLPDGALDRKALASRAFASSEGTALLSSLTHPAIAKETVSRALEAIDRGQAAVIDAPLLYTAGLDAVCDRVVKIDAPEEVRLSRVCARDGIDETAARRRMDAQKDEYRMSEQADAVVMNDGDMKELIAKALAAVDG
ncbi:MAG: threonylcarbamoyl-AMP synthase [Clostridia bacterium]|nr:threonylcarbamoyl-AMP synthase [Clostridia bacterium]